MFKKSFFVLFFLAVFPFLSWASHPVPGQMEEVKLKTHQLEDYSREAYDMASSYRYYDRWNRRGHGGWGNQYALDHLGVFKEAARHFHHQVETYFQDPQHTEHDYIRLVEIYRDASSTLYDLDAYFYGPFRQKWSVIVEVMRNLAFYYEMGNGEDPNHPLPPPHPIAPVSVELTKVEIGGSFHETVVRISGSLVGPGIKTIVFAGVYVNGVLDQTIDPYNPFYARLKWARFFDRSHRVEIRVRNHYGNEYTVWSREF